MNMLKVIYYMLILFITLFIPLICYISIGLVYFGIDATNTRSLECQNIIVGNTSSVSGDGITFFVNGRVILDTSNGSIIKKWGKLESGDVVYMKYGKQTGVFC